MKIRWEKAAIWILTKIFKIAMRCGTTLADDENLSVQYSELSRLGLKLCQALTNDQ